MSKLKDYKAVNEPVLSYLKNSIERKNIEAEYENMFNSKTDIPLYIGSEKIFTERRKDILPPHDHKNIVGTYSQSEEGHVKSAIDNLLKNKTALVTGASSGIGEETVKLLIENKKKGKEFIESLLLKYAENAQIHH